MPVRHKPLVIVLRPAQQHESLSNAADHIGKLVRFYPVPGAAEEAEEYHGELGTVSRVDTAFDGRYQRCYVQIKLRNGVMLENVLWEEFLFQHKEYNSGEEKGSGNQRSEKGKWKKGVGVSKEQAKKLRKVVKGEETVSRAALRKTGRKLHKLLERREDEQEESGPSIGWPDR